MDINKITRISLKENVVKIFQEKKLFCEKFFETKEDAKIEYFKLEEKLNERNLA